MNKLSLFQLEYKFQTLILKNNLEPGSGDHFLSYLSLKWP